MPDLIAMSESENGLDLSRYSVAKYLFALWHQKSSGVATFQKQKAVRKLALVKGEPAVISSNVRSDLLSQILFRLNKISEAEAKQLETAAQKGRFKPTDLLRQLGRLKDQEVIDFALIAQRERLKALFSLNQGAVKFASNPGQQGAAISGFFRGYFDGISSFVTPSHIQRDFSEVTPDSHVIYDADKFYELEAVPFSPEEKGIATIASTADKVSNIYQDSLLEEHEIAQNMVKLILLGCLRLESPTAKEERVLEESLSEEQKEIKASFLNMLSGLEHNQDYFSVLGIQKTASEESIKSRFVEIQKLFPAAEMNKLFTQANQTKITAFNEQLKKAYAILSVAKTRQEYQQFIESGGQGSFEGQSKTIAVDRAVNAGRKLLQQNQNQEAYVLFAKALSSMPNDPQLLAWTGLALYRTGQEKDKAKQLLAKARQEDKHSVEAHLLSGEISVLEGATDEAKTLLGHALKLAPSNARAKELLMNIDEDAAIIIEIEALGKNLDNLSYYELLGIPREAKRAEIQKAFHRRTKQFHPDRFFTKDDPTLKENAGKLYKRTVEAYMVLKTPMKRSEYDQQLKSASRGDKQVRLKDAGDVVQRKERAKVEINNSQALKFYTLALTCMRQNNMNGAILNLKMALNAEPDNAVIQKKLAEAQAKSG